MFKKLLFFVLIFFNISFATTFNIEDYIKENSENFETFQNNPSKIYASSPTLLYLLYALAPEKISGVNFTWNNFEKPYIKDFVLNQPVVGGFFGQGKIPNTEMLLTLDLDLILINANSKNMKKMGEIFGSVKKPILYLKGTTFEDYIQSWQILGELLNKQDRANELISYAKNSIKLSEKLNEDIEKQGIKKPTIYYAQGKDGLQTECDGSLHALLIPLSGAKIVHKCDKKGSDYGRVQISFEQVLSYQPDIILAYDLDFYNKIFEDKKWQLLDAVKNKRVYYIPREPFSWFDRPPSFMRFLGLKWLSSLVHEELANIDIKKETKDFYKLFLDVDLSDENIDKILKNSLK